ncbi:hypothetical protein P3T27_005930 [Kitasatospora sp. MAA19]|nr:hypothetical protein [Kitasatospora sp. MAA19]
MDHGGEGSGEPVAGLLRPGNAGSNTAADSGAGTHEFLNWLTAHGRWLSYSVGMTITEAIHQAVLLAPASAWTPAVEPDGVIRDGAWVAELTGDVLKGWPKGMRLIVRKERPPPGAQLRFTDADGMRLTCLATNTTHAPITHLELRHRRRARAPLGAQAPAASPVLRRPPGDHRPPPLARSGPPLALDRDDHHRVRATASPAEARLTSNDTLPRRTILRPEQWNPAPTRRGSRAAGMPATRPRSRNGPPYEPTDRHEGSRLVRADLHANIPNDGQEARDTPRPWTARYQTLAAASRVGFSKRGHRLQPATRHRMILPNPGTTNSLPLVTAGQRPSRIDTP